MKRTPVSETTTQLTRYGFVNAYLVREEDGYTLVDTTMNAAGHILAAADAPIRRIALTHGHGDHIGSLDALKKRLPEAEVAMPDIDAQIHASEGKKPKGSWPKLETQPDVRLRAGDRVGSLEVVASPGHTPGHVSFLDTRDRTLIAGDTFTSFGTVQVSSHFYWRFPLAAMATEDAALDVESAKALRALEPRLLLVGHGPAVLQPVEAMERAIAIAS